MFRLAVLALLPLFAVCSRANGQNLILTKNSEAAFQAFINGALTGRLGDGIVNANVSVAVTKADIDLVRADGTHALLHLTLRKSASAPSRYFEIEFGDGATVAEAAQTGRLLDQVFQSDPFELTFNFLDREVDASFPTVIDAWRFGGLMRAFRVLSGRMTLAVGLHYALFAIVISAGSLLASVVILWTSQE